MAQDLFKKSPLNANIAHLRMQRDDFDEVFGVAVRPPETHLRTTVQWNVK